MGSAPVTLDTERCKMALPLLPSEMHSPPTPAPGFCMVLVSCNCLRFKIWFEFVRWSQCLHSAAGWLRKQFPGVFSFCSIRVNDFPNLRRGVQMLGNFRESWVYYSWHIGGRGLRILRIKNKEDHSAAFLRYLKTFANNRYEGKMS